MYTVHTVMYDRESTMSCIYSIIVSVSLLLFSGMKSMKALQYRAVYSILLKHLVVVAELHHDFIPVYIYITVICL